MCENRVPKPEHKHLETKGLTHIMYMPWDFQMKWMRYILRKIHDMHFWLDQPIYITKKMIHRITGLPMLNKAKMTKTLGWAKLAKRTITK